MAGDFNAGKLKSVLPHFSQHVTCANRGEKNSRLSLLLTQRGVHSSPLPSIWQIYEKLMEGYPNHLNEVKQFKGNATKIIIVCM